MNLGRLSSTCYPLSRIISLIMATDMISVIFDASPYRITSHFQASKCINMCMSVCVGQMKTCRRRMRQKTIGRVRMSRSQRQDPIKKRYHVRGAVTAHATLVHSVPITPALAGSAASAHRRSLATGRSVSGQVRTCRTVWTRLIVYTDCVYS